MMNLVFRTIDVFQFEQAKLILTSENISFQIRNTVASMYNNFGTYEIYVSSRDENRAKELLENVFK
jgi:hypothetical protein